jgi:ABC-type glycerol-3-phosphate transport system substrate-binding protein
MKNRFMLSLIILCIATAFTGCSKTDGSDAASLTPTTMESKTLEPVTLKMYQTQGYWSDDDFNAIIAEPVKKKYPHITIEFEPKTTVEQALTAGAPFDLVAVWNGLMPQYDDMGLFEDITPLVKKFNMDLSRFDPGALEAIKAATKSGQLYGLPNLLQFYATYYNKDIFDKFGVPYPKDGMTWEDAIEVAKKITRMDGGTQYLGLDPDYLTRMLVPMSLGIVDGRTDKTDVNTEAYKKVFELTKQIYDIPGNKPAGGKVMTGSVTDRFLKDKNVGMLTTINLFDQIQKAPAGTNWDVAQFPSYKERANLYGSYDMHIMTVAKNSQHKDDAFRVLEVLFSDEAQLLSSRRGKLPAMKDPKFNQEFLKGIPELKDKHIQSIFKSKPAPATPPYSIYYTKARGLLVDKFRDYVDGKKDVNTALREAEDETNKYIQSEKK